MSIWRSFLFQIFAKLLYGTEWFDLLLPLSAQTDRRQETPYRHLILAFVLQVEILQYLMPFNKCGDLVEEDSGHYEESTDIIQRVEWFKQELRTLREFVDQQYASDEWD